LPTERKKGKNSGRKKGRRRGKRKRAIGTICFFSLQYPFSRVGFLLPQPGKSQGEIQ
jgi:hypothetical protein